MAAAALALRVRNSQKQRTAARARLIDLDLLDFIPALTPSFHGQRAERPEHLRSLCRVWDRIAAGEKDLRVLISVPPQHAKTVTLSHGLARQLAREPFKQFIYVSYGDKLAEAKSRDIRDYTLRAGVELRADAQEIGRWLTNQGGGFIARSVLGGITGEPSQGVVVDDPFKNREDAESALVREKVHAEFVSTITPRVHPGGFILVCGARWHDDDLIGRLEKEVDANGKKVWEVINLPAIQRDGSPLWHRRPLEFLETHRRMSEHNWWSQWMGQPRPKGDRLFSRVGFYDKLPIRYRVGKGLDLAYAAKKSSHWSAGVVLLADADEQDPDKRKYYVVDVRRRQARVRDFAKELSHVKWPGAWHWFTSSTEVGVAELMTELGDVSVDAVKATEDKYARAQPASAAWNEGRILLPRTMAAVLGERAQPQDFDREPEWLREFSDEVTRFTGVADKSDDQVDGLASAFEQVRFAYARPRIVSGCGSRYGEERGVF